MMRSTFSKLIYAKCRNVTGVNVLTVSHQLCPSKQKWHQHQLQLRSVLHLFEGSWIQSSTVKTEISVMIRGHRLGTQSKRPPITAQGLQLRGIFLKHFMGQQSHITHVCNSCWQNSVKLRCALKGLWKKSVWNEDRNVFNVCESTVYYHTMRCTYLNIIHGWRVKKKDQGEKWQTIKTTFCIQGRS